MKKGRASRVVVAASAVIACGFAPQSEGNEPREWTFNPRKVWELQRLGDQDLLRPAEPRIAEDGTIFFRDFERDLGYVVDADGELAGTFAPSGDGDGKVSRYINCFSTGNGVVVGAPDRLHFFTRRGEFLKSVPNDLFARFPLAFKDDNEFWVAPGALGDAPGSEAEVIHVDLSSGEEAPTFGFERSEEERRPTGGAVVLGLTPQILMGLDRRSGRIYFGKNSEALVYHADADGADCEPFSLDATRRAVSQDEKKAYFASVGLPEAQVEAMAQALPDRMAFHHRIQVVDGLVYLFSTDGFDRRQAGQDVDIYSPLGRHLYHGRLQVEDGWHCSHPDNLQLGDGFVCAILENGAGDRKVVKYEVDLPASSGFAWPRGAADGSRGAGCAGR